MGPLRIHHRDMIDMMSAPPKLQIPFPRRTPLLMPLCVSRLNSTPHRASPRFFSTVHTHLFPESHGSLMLWGVDELLTYHYLVAEFFQTAPLDLTHEDFFALPKAGQADLIWRGLFVERSPVSEACRGVLMSLTMLGLGEHVASRDLAAVRAWFAAQDPAEHIERVFTLAKVKYVVMTNVPFTPAEAAVWGKPTASTAGAAAGVARAGAAADAARMSALTTPRFRSALRADPLLSGDWAQLCAELASGGYEPTAEGARAYLGDWVDRMK